MPLAEAQALVRDLKVAPFQPPADRRALEQLAEACERLTPCVALEEGSEPESLLLDISNLEHLWGSETRLVAQVEKFFARRGYRVRVAVANTIGLAWAIAHFRIADCFNQSEIELPIESLRIPSETATLLRELGIETIDQLLSLPRDGLAQRFGGELLRRLDQLTGAAQEVIEPHRALAPWQTAYSLDEPTADRAVLMHVLSELVNRLTRQLAARDQGAVQLLCTLRCMGDRTVSLQIGLLQPSANPRQLLELIELHLEQLTLADEVDRVELQATIVGRLGERQGELFEGRWPADSHQLALLANRLSSRLGGERVLRAELKASPVPERAVRWMPVAMQSRVKSRESRARKIRTADFGLRMKDSQSEIRNPKFAIPLLLHPKPEAIEVTCVAPDGPPQFVWLDRRRERVVNHVGPERIETLWWRGPSVRRDYYRIATEDGSHLWIFRELTNARWFLHGEFD